MPSLKNLSKDNFLKELRHLRKQAGLTQTQLAEASGLSLKSISLLETGNFCTDYTLGRIAKALGITITRATKEYFSITIETKQNETERN